MRHLCLLTLILAARASLGQWVPETPILDFGEVVDEKGLLMESYFDHESEKEGLLLRVEGDGPLIDVKIQSKRVSPKGRMLYRVKLLPRRQGTIREELIFHFTDESIPVRIRADISDDRALSLTPCPDFGSEASSAPAAPIVETRFNVVDEKTGKGIPRARIILTSKKGLTIETQTNPRGRAQVDLPLDYYVIMVRHPGYAQLELESYINRTRDDFQLELRPGPGFVVSRRPSEPQADRTEDSIPIIPAEIEIIEEANTVDSGIIDPFPLSDFRPNHLVFLVDVSTSMGQSGRMEIVREQLSGLVGMLRPEDHLSLITYADQAEITLLNAPVNSIESVKPEIEDLRAEGGTAGGNALKKAYAISRRHFIEEGNNHVFLISDGAFNKDSGRLKRLIRRQAEQDIRLSVICVKSSQWMTLKMGELAAAGEGSVLSLDTEQGSDRLRQLIKSQCSR